MRSTKHTSVLIAGQSHQAGYQTRLQFFFFRQCSLWGQVSCTWVRKCGGAASAMDTKTLQSPIWVTWGWMRDLLCSAGCAGCFKLLYFPKKFFSGSVCVPYRQIEKFKSRKLCCIYITGQLLTSVVVSIQAENAIFELISIYLFKNTTQLSHLDSSGNS